MATCNSCRVRELVLLCVCVCVFDQLHPFLLPSSSLISVIGLVTNHHNILQWVCASHFNTFVPFTTMQYVAKPRAPYSMSCYSILQVQGCARYNYFFF